jgi:hypothetical protein
MRARCFFELLVPGVLFGLACHHGERTATSDLSDGGAADSPDLRLSQCMSPDAGGRLYVEGNFLGSPADLTGALSPPELAFFGSDGDGGTGPSNVQFRLIKTVDAPAAPAAIMDNLYLDIGRVRGDAGPGGYGDALQAGQTYSFGADGGDGQLVLVGMSAQLEPDGGTTQYVALDCSEWEGSFTLYQVSGEVGATLNQVSLLAAFTASCPVSRYSVTGCTWLAADFAP